MESSAEGERGEWSLTECFIVCFALTLGQWALGDFMFWLSYFGIWNYLAMLILTCLLFQIPAIQFEMTLGFLYKRGLPGILNKIAPSFRGLSWTLNVFCLLQVMSMTLYAAWMFYFFCISFGSQLDYALCHHSDRYCSSALHTRKCQSLYGTEFMWFHGKCQNISLNHWARTSHLTKASHHYWEMVVGFDTHGHGLGPYRWQSGICLIPVWLLIGLIVVKGPRSIPKGLSALLALSMLVLVFLVFGITASDSFKFKDLITHVFGHEDQRWNLMHVYYKVLSMMEWSFVCFGLYTTMTSFVPSGNKIGRNRFRKYAPIAVTLLSLIIPTLMGVIFSILKEHVNTMVSQKQKWWYHQEVLFENVPDALTVVRYGPLWAVLLYGLSFLLIVCSIIPVVWSLVVNISDQWPVLYMESYRAPFRAIVCCAMLILNQAWSLKRWVFMAWFNKASIMSSAGLILIVLICAIAYGYGYKRFEKDAETDFGIERPKTASDELFNFQNFLKVSLLFFIPGILGVVSCSYWSREVYYISKYAEWFPSEFLAAVILIALAPIILTAADAVLKFIQRRKQQESAQDQEQPSDSDNEEANMEESWSPIGVVTTYIQGTYGVVAWELFGAILLLVFLSGGAHMDTEYFFRNAKQTTYRCTSYDYQKEGVLYALLVMQLVSMPLVLLSLCAGALKFSRPWMFKAYYIWVTLNWGLCVHVCCSSMVIAHCYDAIGSQLAEIEWAFLALFYVIFIIGRAICYKLVHRIEVSAKLVNVVNQPEPDEVETATNPIMAETSSIENPINSSVGEFNPTTSADLDGLLM